MVQHNFGFARSRCGVLVVLFEIRFLEKVGGQEEENLGLAEVRVRDVVPRNLPRERKEIPGHCE